MLSMLCRKGGGYFRGQESKQLVYLEKGRGWSSASTRESAIKKLLRVDKILLISSLHNQINKNIGIDI